VLTQHVGELGSFLRSIDDIGCGHIRAKVLKGWFGAANASKSMWREIADKWSEISPDVSLLVAQFEGGYSFAYGAGLTVDQDSDEAWFVSIETWC
jgi:hypothetical protein